MFFRCCTWRSSRQVNAVQAVLDVFFIVVQIPAGPGENHAHLQTYRSQVGLFKDRQRRLVYLLFIVPALLKTEAFYVFLNNFEPVFHHTTNSVLNYY